MQLVNRNPSASELHKFGWAMIFGFGVIGAILWYFGPEPNGIAWRGVFQQKFGLGLWILGVVLLVVSFGPAGLARPVYVGWMTVAMYLGTVMTFLMLSLMFFILLPVFALIRLKDPLRLKLLPPGESYWEDHAQHEATLERTIRPF